jgi:hypothetical protein
MNQKTVNKHSFIFGRHLHVGNVKKRSLTFVPIILSQIRERERLRGRKAE